MSPVDVASVMRDGSRPGNHGQEPVRHRRRRIIVSVALIVLCYVYWALLLRWFFLQRDDFWLISITDDPLGRFDAGEFFWRWGHDWLFRNGRSSDALVRAMLRPGLTTFTWLAPAVLTACFAAAWNWLPRERGRTNIAGLALALYIVPIVLLTEPSISGNTVFWAAGIGNYVVPTGVAVFATSWWVRDQQSRGAAVLAVSTMLLAGALHELAALAVVTVAATWWHFHRRDVTRRTAVVLLASLASLVIGFVGPGRWRRLDALAGDETGVAAWISSAARFTAELLLETGPVWAALVVALVVAVLATWRDGTVTQRRWRAASLLVVAVSGTTAWMLARAWREPTLRCSQSVPLGDGNAPASVAMLLTAGLAVIAAAVLLTHLRAGLGDAPVLLGAGALSTLPLPMATGQCAPRVWYPTLVWVLLLVTVILVWLVAGRYLPRVVLVLTTITALLLAGRFFLLAEPALRGNHASFTSVVDQVATTREAGAGTIVFPDEVPFPEFGKEPVYRLPSIACGFRTYYAVPDTVLLDDGTSPPAGQADYCPRPDDARAGG